MYITLIESDCRSELDGYHFNVWENICEVFGVDPDGIEAIELSVYRIIPKENDDG